ncbi:hypothetical protein DXU06_43310 [Bradyrhizobium elkanii]|nr:hypothetical protein XI02_10885 [Bradyrhizobium sp. CCBAU 21365]
MLPSSSVFRMRQLSEFTLDTLKLFQISSENYKVVGSGILMALHHHNCAPSIGRPIVKLLSPQQINEVGKSKRNGDAISGKSNTRSIFDSAFQS